MFLFLLLLSIVLIVLGVVCFTVGMDSLEDWPIPVGAISIILGFIGAIVFGIGFVSWESAKQKALILNERYDTNYTTKQVFYAESVIDEIRQIERFRSESTINLNIDKK